MGRISSLLIMFSSWSGRQDKNKWGHDLCRNVREIRLGTTRRDWKKKVRNIFMPTLPFQWRKTFSTTTRRGIVPHNLSNGCHGIDRWLFECSCCEPSAAVVQRLAGRSQRIPGWWRRHVMKPCCISLTASFGLTAVSDRIAGESHKSFCPGGVLFPAENGGQSPQAKKAVPEVKIFDFLRRRTAGEDGDSSGGDLRPKIYNQHVKHPQALHFPRRKMTLVEDSRGLSQCWPYDRCTASGTASTHGPQKTISSPSKNCRPTSLP